MKKLKLRKWVIIVMILISTTILIYSSYKIITWKVDSNKTQKQVDELIDIVPTIEVDDTIDTIIVEQKEEIPKEDPYWDYINMNLIDVDLKELKKKNNHTIGWIKVNGTNINYPFVQTKNNNYYLNHSFDKSYNQAGWVFLDYRNNKDLLDKNNIIYAHGREDNTMFGSLKNILKSSWIKDTNNYVIKISTSDANSLWQVFSVYRIPTTNDYIQTDFVDDNEFLVLVDTLISRSNYDFKTSVSSSDKILTLSTCYNLDDKVVLHAKLIKYEKKS